jgi:trans-aconitate methyltransferase
MDRILEPEIMDGQAEADAYARADFADSNQWCADHLAAEYPDHLKEIVDLGCGPGDRAPYADKGSTPGDVSGLRRPRPYEWF